MDKGKSVRKYGRLARSLRWSKYIVHQGLLFPVTALAVVAAVGGILSLLISAGAIIYFAIYLYFGGNGMAFLDLICCFIGLILSAVIACCGIKFLDISVFGLKGTILNPLPPEENPVLPDAELLVRPSSSSAAQPAELLRAAQETTQEKPEELLRTTEETTPAVL